MYSIEIIEALAQQATRSLLKLGYHNIETRIDDGYHGWPEQAPFDAVIVTAATEQLPRPLLDQLKPGGRMVLPIDDGAGRQELVALHKDTGGRISSRSVLPVRFVPFTRR